MNSIFYFLCILTTITLSLFMNNDASAQSLAGRYGGVQDGFCLFDNGRFFLYGYATLVPGTYHVEKDHIRFVPDKPANTFIVFARENKALQDSVRMYFNGFERGKTFIQFNDGKTRRVFNEDANCFKPPYIYEAAAVPSQIIFSHVDSDFGIEKMDHNTEIYSPEKKYNDFVFLYQKPNRYQEPFVGVVTKEEGETVLRTSLTGSRGLLHQPNDKEVEEMKAYLGDDKKKEEKEDVLYANRFYKLLTEIDTAEYTYNAAAGQYTAHDTPQDKLVTEYNDVSVLYKYMLLGPASKEKRAPGKVQLPPVFYTACGDPENSYRYKPLDEPSTPPDGPLPTTTAPVQIK
ncbi:hypothetical protein SAMN04488128_102119 [Chitinophaga eiseniae]|uniref:DKNYY family protein n=1 Tax=Chitinophaga eiseniae TaxID=634771 RepID=A0A1T4Q1X6_9BACT|nr:hypothetical protein [Chitinophaga eiseniae]SJZ97616.1 hypothetical protein SAMN04488128_102119 [Chitinophaga eiseniae]